MSFVRFTHSVVLATVCITSAFDGSAQQQGLIEARDTLDELTAQFDRSESDREKRLAALRVLRFAHSQELFPELDREVFLYLVDEASEALTFGEPCPLDYDAEGHVIKGQLSGALIQWAAANGLSTSDAARIALREHPQDVAALVGSDDSLALGVFEDALAAENCVVVFIGAEGFAAVNHSEAIDQITTVADASPADLALALAEALDRFDDPEAHTAADSIRAAQSP